MAPRYPHMFCRQWPLVSKAGFLPQCVPNNEYFFRATRIAVDERVSGFPYTYSNFDLCKCFGELVYFMAVLKRLTPHLSQPTNVRPPYTDQLKDTEILPLIGSGLCGILPRGRAVESWDLSGICRPAGASWKSRMEATRPDHAS